MNKIKQKFQVAQFANTWAAYYNEYGPPKHTPVTSALHNFLTNIWQHKLTIQSEFVTHNTSKHLDKYLTAENKH